MTVIPADCFLVMEHALAEYADVSRVNDSSEPKHTKKYSSAICSRLQDTEQDTGDASFRFILTIAFS